MKKKLSVIVATAVALSTVLSFTGNSIVRGEVMPKSVLSSAYINEMDNHSLIMDSFKRYLAGDEVINSISLVDAKVKTIHDNAKKALDNLLDTENRRNEDGTAQLFKGSILGSEDIAKNNSYLSSSYASLYNIALATKTYKRTGSSGANNYYKNEDAKVKVIEALEWLYTNYFEDQQNGYYGNWYSWEIGMPMNITKTLMLLKDEINAKNPTLIENYIKSMDLYLRNGKDGDIDLNSRFHTGANLADIATNRIIQGALLNDDLRIQKAVDNLLTVFKTIDPNNIVNNNTDGYYEDGSFIQHHRVAYTGSYGKTLLTRVIQTLNILEGSEYDKKETLAPIVKDWIYKGFSPVIFEGYMMEIVKGRAISRTGTGYADVNAVVEAMVELTKYLDGNEKDALRAHIKHVVGSMKAGFSSGSFVSPSAIIEYDKLQKDSTITPRNYLEAGNHFALNSMDKTVHVRDSYAFSISRSSNRISKYEYMSGENLMPWFQGDGAFYLYQSGVDQSKAYGANYLATISPYKLPGTTVPVEERKTIPELYDGKLFYDNPTHPLNFIASSESQNDYVYFPVGTNTFSGGVKLDKYGVSGIVLGDEIGYKDKQAGLLPDDFVVYKNAEANKSYFMFDDEIVLMGSGVKDKLNRKLITTVDNKIFDKNEKVNIVGKTYDNKNVDNSSSGNYNLKWLNFKANTLGTSTGYYFLDNKTVNLETSTVTESLRKIRTGNADTMVTKNYFTMLYNHEDTSKSDKYAYVILPNADVKKTEDYANEENIKVLANTDTVHAVSNIKLNMKGFNFFGDKVEQVEEITSFNKASVMIRYNDDNTVNIAVSDPTFSLDKMKLEVEIDDPKVISASQEVDVIVAKKKALIKVDSKNSNGKTFEITLEIQGRKNN